MTTWWRENKESAAIIGGALVYFALCMLGRP